MANRRDYSISLAGQCSVLRYDGVWITKTVPQARTASRTATDYSRKKPKGPFKAPTLYSMQETSSVRNNGSYAFYKKNGTPSIACTGVVNSDWGIPGPGNWALQDAINRGLMSGLTESPPAGLAGRAQRQAWTKLKNQKVNLGQAFAERRQTAGLVVENLSRIISTVRHIRNLPRTGFAFANGANTVVKDLPNWWLEVVFGWKPLLSDIHGAVSELDSRDHSEFIYTVTGQAKSEAKLQGYNPGSQPGAPESSYASADVSLFHGAFCRIDAVPSSSAFKKASALGLTNPLSLAWELLPWSFVVDWALPLGPYFDSLDAPIGVDILGMSTSVLSRAKSRSRGLPAPRNDGKYYVNNTRASYSLVKLSRTPVVTFPYQILPRIKDPFNSAQRVGTCLALLGQVFGRSR